MDKKVRAKNWSGEECNMLVSMVGDRYKELFGKHSLTCTQHIKQRIWAAIASDVSALGTKRNPKECVKKYGYLKSSAKEHVNDRGKTGGGSPLPPTPEIYRRILDVVPRDAMFGINGGLQR
jgi:hypothetical protein